MKFTLLALFGAAAALPPAPRAPRAACTNPVVRKEWRKATVAQRVAYLDAAVCITKKPSPMQTHPNATLQDDFAYVHAMFSPSESPVLIHGVPAFLPWHRFFLHLYEKALRDCGYSGPMLYWDFVQDAADVPSSPVWDTVTGFGGNGTALPNNGRAPRVVNGPFKDWQPLYFNLDVSPHGLARNWLPSQNPGAPVMAGDNYNQAMMDEIFTETTLNGFRARLEPAHDSVHTGVGGGTRSQGGGSGDLSGNNASPNDPIFFALHGGVDRLWWKWQQAKPGRTMMYDGNFRTDGGPAVTLDDPLPMVGLGVPAKVRDYMDTRGPVLCYKYE